MRSFEWINSSSKEEFLPPIALPRVSPIGSFGSFPYKSLGACEVGIIK
jgi:hypothetical protein